MIAPWWLMVLGGLLGSTHCIGMCGGFAVMLGLHCQSWQQNLRSQLLFSLGRLASYGSLGAVAGFAGKSLASRLPAMVNVPAMLSVIAGLFLLWEGLHATGLLHRRQSTSAAGCLFRPLFAALLKHRGWRNVFSAGIFTGLLPCGLVYAFVSLAATSGDLLQGALTMLAFGFGTVPLMLSTGAGAMLLGVSMRQRVWQVAAWSVVVSGLLTLGRGITFLQKNEAEPAARCPYCAISAK